MLVRKIRSAAAIIKEKGLTGLFKAVKEEAIRLSDFRTLRDRAGLERILNSSKKGLNETIIYFPGIDWNLPLFQRPQHLATHLARKGCLVFYCTSNVAYDDFHGFTVLEKGLYLTDRPDILLSELRGCWIMVSSIAYMGIETIREFKALGFRILYDYMDEINPEICGDPAEDYMKRHKALDAESVDLITVISRKLYDEMVEKFPASVIAFVPNAVDYDHFHIKKDMERCPEDIKPVVLSKRPVIGYHGALAKWIDYGLINFIASERPEWNLVLIGWDYDNSMQALAGHKNIVYLGLKTYRELPLYSIWFDAAIIPFVEGEIAKATSPIKLYEYMAMNKPVVAAKDLVECRGLKGVLSASGSRDFISKIECALELAGDAGFINIVDEEAKANRWEAAAMKIKRRLNK